MPPVYGFVLLVAGDVHTTLFVKLCAEKGHSPGVVFWFVRAFHAGQLELHVADARVRLRDAVAGGLIASLAFELGKRAFTAYLVKVPTYKALYGAFAVLPMFLLGVYFS